MIKLAFLYCWDSIWGRAFQPLNGHNFAKFRETVPGHHGRINVQGSLKTSMWFLTFEFVAICLAGWIFSSLLVYAIRNLGGGVGTIPAVTRAVLFPNTWILFCPVPWLIYVAVLSRCRELSRGKALIFQWTILVATILFAQCRDRRVWPASYGR